ncbi:MAG: phosphopyruvate hydratase, partial [Eubacteriales bacterium]
MNIKRNITSVVGREILDSRGNPTVEVEVTIEWMWSGRAAVPSGASTGRFEAVELRDGEKRYLGQGVKRAIHNIHTILAPAIIGHNGMNQGEIDRLLIHADGTENKSKVG